MLHVLIKKLSRECVVRGLFFLPESRRIAIERRMRGREEFRKLSQADGVVVSFGKSGRTWLRVMLSRYYQQCHGLAGYQLMGFDNLHRRNAAIPKLFFTHDNYLADYTGHHTDKSDFAACKVVLLVRDPRDVVVSQYFQWKFRMRRGKKALNGYPAHDSELSAHEFAIHDGGLKKVIDFLNGWGAALEQLPQLCIVRYEDMRQRPQVELERVVRFLDDDRCEALALADAVEFASYDNMKKLESEKVFWLSGSRMVPKDRSNPDSFKVRRAKVGGYRDYFDETQREQIEQYIDDHLLPVFGYTRREDAELPLSH